MEPETPLSSSLLVLSDTWAGVEVQSLLDLGKHSQQAAFQLGIPVSGQLSHLT